MYIRNNTVAWFFGIESWWSSLSIGSPFWELIQSHGYENTILLGKERTLYDYDLQCIYEFCKKYSHNILTILCEWLSSARWNGTRRWINTQDERSNFSVNIFVTLPKNQYQSVQDLQERIAMGIMTTLSWVSTRHINIAYPFHFLQDGGKIAGHLVQKKNIDKNTEFLRIGIGINTNTQVPRLPDNDELAQRLYWQPSTLSLEPSRWIALANNLRENIIHSLESSRHDDYLNSLNIENWDTVEITHDNGTISFWEILKRWQFDTINTDGKIHLIWEMRTLELWDYHMRLIRRN